jgi:hypothetical protein
MKKIKTILLIILGCSSVAVFAQEVAEAPKRSRISSLQLSYGIAFSENLPSTLSNFQQLAPASEGLNQAMGGNSWYYFNSSPQFHSSFLLGIDLKSKYKPNKANSPKLRIGLTHVSNEVMNNSFYTRHSKPIDTINNSTYGTLYLDSVKTTSYDASYKARELRFDISILFSTLLENRWSLFAGLGLQSGLSYTTNTFVKITQNEGVYDQNDRQYYSGYTTFFSNYKRDYEEHANKANIINSIYAPMGIKFRIAKKDPFFSRMSLIYEARPYIQFRNIPELGTFASGDILNNLGLKVDF